MKISVIIAVKEDNPFLRECLQKTLKLVYQDYEVLVLPDQEFVFSHEHVRVVPTGPCLPARKRDIGAEHAKGEVLAFLDDDAYPCEEWLTLAVKDFQDPEVAAVGGPAVTPPTEELMRRAGGLVYESFLISGPLRYRYRKEKKRLIDDYPSCNLLVRKDIFEQLGGFKTNFWPGEDTVLCLEITQRLKKKIVYDPEVLVFHHRRPLYLPHLKQVKNYALHRGYFVKRFPETSLRWHYFIPSVFLLWLIFGLVLSFAVSSLFFVWFISVGIYALFVIFSSYEKRDLKLSRLAALGIFLTHMTYGLFFLFGLLQSKLNEET